jgi:hypothetical protein
MTPLPRKRVRNFRCCPAKASGASWRMNCCRRRKDVLIRDGRENNEAKIRGEASLLGEYYERSQTEDSPEVEPDAVPNSSYQASHVCPDPRARNACRKVGNRNNRRK